MKGRINQNDQVPVKARNNTPPSSPLLRRRKRIPSGINLKQTVEKANSDDEAAGDPDLSTGEAVLIQQQHRRLFSKLRDLPRRVVTAITYHRFFSVTSTVAIVAIVLLLVYKGK